MSRYVYDVTMFGHTVIPPHLLTADGRRILPPLDDLGPGFFATCAGCAIAPVNEACDECPRRSVSLYRQLTRPPWWRRMIGRIIHD